MQQTVTPQTRAEHRRVTEQRVVEAARGCFTEVGFAETTIRAIAVAAGVSTGTVMSVGDKSALLVRVFDGLIEDQHRQRDRDGRARDRISGATCAERLLHLVRPFITIFAEHPQLTRVYAATLVSGDQASSLFTELADALIDEFRAAIVAQSCTDPAEAPVRARALYFAYVGALISWPAGRKIVPCEVEAVLRDTFATICRCTEERP